MRSLPRRRRRCRTYPTDDRSTQGIINMIQATYGKTLTASQINPAAMKLLNAKLPNGQYLIPSPSSVFTSLPPAQGLANAQALG
jgi:hypothetical protein